MALSKKDKIEIAAMIGRGVMAAGRVIDSVDPETVAAASQDETRKTIRNIRSINIAHRENDIQTILNGTVDGQQTVVYVYLNPDETDNVALGELKRIQNHPHLFSGLTVVVKQPPAGRRFIQFIAVNATPTDSGS